MSSWHLDSFCIINESIISLFFSSNLILDSSLIFAVYFLWLKYLLLEYPEKETNKTKKPQNGIAVEAFKYHGLIILTSIVLGLE